ncbi:MAG: hypothetical protein CMJ78_17955 [Planctomycetaceae bacterium]|nr:hypothetical protein [Planctomycetaceae bacterium]
MKTTLFAAALCISSFLANAAFAQVIFVDQTTVVVHTTPNQRRVVAPSSYWIKEVNVQANLRDQVAQVQVSQVFQNTGSRVLETQLIFPMPNDAAVSGLTLVVDGKEMVGKLHTKQEARRIYESIVRRRRDPALLEYIGHGMFQTSVFPVPPGKESRVEIRYSQLLKKDNGLIDFSVPISRNKHCNRPVDSLSITTRISTGDPIKTIYSPTHDASIERTSDSTAVCKLQLRNVRTTDDFRMFYGTQNGLVGMNVISYRPNPKEDGYFLLLASPEVKHDPSKKIPKTTVFVLDRSGSMNGQKMEQARAALKYFLNQLKETGESDLFNIVAYDSAVESFRPELQRADDKTIQQALGFVDGLFAGGSTNIDGALKTSFAMLSNPQRPSYVMFLTDGLPTVGVRDPRQIAANAKSSNKISARMFNFGVGYDVNSRLLDQLSRGNRGQSVYVRPNEDIESHVASLYNKIASPMLTDIAVDIDFDVARSESAPPPVNRRYPKQLTDLFRGEQLVLVGRYKQSGLAKVTLTGHIGGVQKRFSFPVNLVEKSLDESNGFVEKLWAARRIGEIIDDLDLNGHNKELVDELVRLSIQHGIMTPYTSFLADESVVLGQRGLNLSRANAEVSEQLSRESGRSGFSQRRFKSRLQATKQLPSVNEESDADAAIVSGGISRFGGRPANRAAPAGAGASLGGGGFAGGKDTAYRRRADRLRQVGQKAFFYKQNRWQDSTVTSEQEKKAERIVQFSDKYFELAASQGGKLAKYLVFNESVILNLDGKVYQIDPAPVKAN